VVVSDFYEGGYDKDKLRSRVQYLFSKIMIWCDYIYICKFYVTPTPHFLLIHIYNVSLVIFVSSVCVCVCVCVCVHMVNIHDVCVFLFLQMYYSSILLVRFHKQKKMYLSLSLSYYHAGNLTPCLREKIPLDLSRTNIIVR